MSDPRPRSSRVSPRDGYLRLNLQTVRGKVTRLVHRLVGEAFLGPRPDGMETRHLNGNKLDNRPSNLAYGTPVENMDDYRRHQAEGVVRPHSQVMRVAAARRYAKT